MSNPHPVPPHCDRRSAALGRPSPTGSRMGVPAAPPTRAPTPAWATRRAVTFLQRAPTLPRLGPTMCRLPGNWACRTWAYSTTL